MGFGLGAVVADSLNRAAFEGFLTESDIIFSRRLLVDERVTSIVVAREEIRRGFAAEIAVNTLLIDVELTCYICFPLVVFVCHSSLRKKWIPQ